jgi:hypothetical protein
MSAQESLYSQQTALFEEMIAEVPEAEFEQESAVESAVKKPAPKEDKKFKPIKGEQTLRTKYDKAIQVAAKSMQGAHTKSEKAAAKTAVKAALADAGVADADNAGTIAWADRNVKVAKGWADKALKHDANSLGRVAAWTKGDREEGLKMRRKCERAVQAMIAVASATKNKEMVARENKLRAEGKMKSFDKAIKKARQSARYAAKSVDSARAALALTMGTKGRIAAKHALIRAQDALDDANKILEMEVKKKNVVTENRLQSDGERLVGENELHYDARKLFHRANRVLKLVEVALNSARKNHYAHKEAAMKRAQKVTQEKASKLSDKERTAKSEARRKALNIKTKEEYAAYLAKEALKYGKIASEDAKKAAEAGKLAAEKAKESAHVKSKLGVKHPTSTSTVTEAYQRENIAADLAKKAASMEDAIVTGGKIPAKVLDLISDGNGKVRPTVFDEAQASAMESQSNLNEDEDFHEFVTHRKKWMAHYKKIYKLKKAKLEDNQPLVH